MEWIKVTDRLPDENTFKVLVAFDEPFFGSTTKEAGVGYYSAENDKWYSDLTGGRLGEIEILRVTHWQPLPKLP